MDKSQYTDYSPGSLARRIINEEFNQPKWEPFRKWYFENFNSDELIYFKNEFYNDIDIYKKPMIFVPWFISKYTDNILSVIERDYNINGKIITKTFPPQQLFKLKVTMK